MRIIVVGAGEVGSYVTEKLSREGHDVILIDLPKETLIGAVLSHDRAEIGRGGVQLHPGDRVVLFAKPTALAVARRAFDARGGPR